MSRPACKGTEDDPVRMSALRICFIVFFSLCLLAFAAPVFTGRIINAGNIAGFAASLIFLVCAVFSNRFFGFVGKLWGTSGGRIFVMFISSVAAVLLLTAAVISGFMIAAMNDRPQGGETAIVLGCKVRGENPSRMLRARLDAAYDYLTEYPDALCIVSGGQGSDEEYAEAFVMKKYLVNRGIDPDRIFEESRSESTAENLRFSMKIMEDSGISGDAVIITDGFHQLRAKMIAAKLGMNVSAWSANTVVWLLPTYWVREWFGVLYQVFLG